MGSAQSDDSAHDTTAIRSAFGISADSFWAVTRSCGEWGLLMVETACACVRGEARHTAEKGELRPAITGQLNRRFSWHFPTFVWPSDSAVSVDSVVV